MKCYITSHTWRPKQNIETVRSSLNNPQFDETGKFFLKVGNFFGGIEIAIKKKRVTVEKKKSSNMERANKVHKLESLF